MKRVSVQLRQGRKHAEGRSAATPMMTAALAIAVAGLGSPASAGVYSFYGSFVKEPGYGAHPIPTCGCLPVADVYNWTNSGNISNPGAYSPFAGATAPGPGDTLVISGTAFTLNVLQGPAGGDPVEPVYGQLGHGQALTGPFNATGSASVAALQIDGAGSFSGSVNASQAIYLEAAGPEPQIVLGIDPNDPNSYVATITSNTRPEVMNISGSLTTGGTAYLEDFADAGSPTASAVINLNGTLTAGSVDVFTSANQPVNLNGSIKATNAINILTNEPVYNQPIGALVSTLAVKGGTISAATLNIGTTSDGSIAPTGVSALVDMTGGTATISGQTLVGVFAQGILDAHDGAKITTTGDTYVSVVKGSLGSEIILDGKGTTYDEGGGFYVGANDKALLKVSDGATLTTKNVLAFGINDGGFGSMDITDGGQVESDSVSGSGTISGTLGNAAGSSGLVTIDGQGSEWDNKQSLAIGYEGDGNLQITNGGLLTVEGLQLRVGRDEGSTGVLVVTGSGSKVDADSATFYVGYGGTGTASFEQGGSISTMATNIGGLDTGIGLLSFDGAGTPSDLGDTTVGDAGQGELDLSGATDQRVGKLTVGAQDDSEGLVEISDQSTRLTADDDVSVGKAGSGELDVADAAHMIANGKLTIGEEAGGEGLVSVSGQGSLLQVQNDDLTVGEAGAGELDIDDNGLVQAEDVKAGANAGAEGVIAVSGGGQLQTNDLTIGGNGDGTMTIADGTVDSAGEGKIADGEDASDGTPGGGGSGEVILSDDNARWNNEALTVGGNGDGTLSVTAGTIATVTDGTIADEEGSTGTADFDGDTALWTIGGGLTVGGKGDGTLTIENGATISIAGAEFKIGDEEGGTGLVTLDGKDSKLNFASGSGSGEITVGGGGSGMLALQDGAQMTTYAVTLGDEASGSGTLALTGEGTQLTINHDLTIGGKGHGDLEIQQKAVVLADGDVKFSDETSGGGTGTIDSGGQLAVGGTLSIGSKAAGSLTVQDGSLVSALGDGVELGENASGIGVLTLTGSDGGVSSTLAAAGEIKVGDGGAGEIDIEGGATLKPTAAGKGLIDIGVQSGSSGVVNVDGAGSSLQAGQVAVGGTMTGVGGGGQIHVTNGAAASISQTLDMWPGGIVSVDGKSSVLLGSGTAAGGALTVGAGGTLEGTGTIDANVVNTGGTVHPGHSPGTLTINGNYTQASDGTLLLSVGPTSYSQLVVNGTATLNGGTVVLQDYQGGHVSLGETFKFIDASGGITGNVGTIVTSDPFLSLSPDIVDGVLTLAAVHTAGSFAATAVTSNQKAVAAGLDAAAMNNASPIVPLAEAISNLSPSSLPAAFDRLSPEGLVAVENAGFADQRAFDGAVGDAAAIPGSASDTGATPAVMAGPWRFWVSGFGNRATFAASSTRALAGATTTDGGFAAGMDYRLADPLLVGIATGYSSAHYSVGARGTSGHTDNAHLAAYAAFAAGPFYANVIAAYDWADGDSSRSTSVAGFGGTVRGNGRNTIASGRIEAGWRWTMGSVTLTPFMSADALRFHQQRYTEASAGDAGILALTIPHQHVSSETINAGIRAETSVQVGKATIAPDIELSYGRQLDTGRHLTAAFASAPDALFTVAGISPARNYGHAGVGLSAILSPMLRLSIKVATDRAAGDHEDSARGAITWSW